MLDPKPFEPLAEPRLLNRPELPPDLAQFYEQNEGVGLESRPDRLIRLCRLDEVARVGWPDLHIFGENDCTGWNSFAGFRIGVSSFFDEILYVIDSPCCPPGAVLTIGLDVSGPGGNGPASLEPSLVLAATFPEWIGHLKASGWIEYGLVPGGLAELPAAEQQELRQYYQALNPGIGWRIASA